MMRIAIVADNSINYIELLFDIWNAGHCAVLLDYNMPFEPLFELMNEAHVRKCYIDNKIFYNMQKNVINSDSEIEFILIDEVSRSAQVLPEYIRNKYRDNYSNEEAIVIYSSGTTGKSKGIILSHYAINTNADSIIAYMSPKETDCFYLAKKLSHSSTLTGELLVALKTGANLVVAPTIMPLRYLLKNISAFGVTLLCLNPTLLSLFSLEYGRVHADISVLRAIYVSGAILNENVRENACDALGQIPIYNVYGLSEAAPRVTAQTSDSVSKNSVGRPIRNVQILIVNEQGNEAACGEYGVIHIKTPSLFSGYIEGEIKHLPMEAGWYNTGDLGYIDNYGELHIIGRIDDMIVCDSHKIYPSQVEKKMVELIKIKDCVVSQVELDNRVILGCLYVSDNEIAPFFRGALLKALLPYEIPKFFIKVNNIPYNSNGKRDMKKIREIMLGGISDGRHL